MIRTAALISLALMFSACASKPKYNFDHKFLDIDGVIIDTQPVTTYLWDGPQENFISTLDVNMEPIRFIGKCDLATSGKGYFFRLSAKYTKYSLPGEPPRARSAVLILESCDHIEEIMASGQT